MNQLGETIKILREEAGITQERIAEYLKIDQSFVSMIEKGTRNVSSDVMEKLAYLFGVDANDMINGNAINPIKISFRSSGVTNDDLDSISAINKIVLNIKKIDKILEM